MDIEPAANPAETGVVTLVDERETALAQQEAETPAGGESDTLDDLAKEALGEPSANPEYLEVEIDGKKLKVLMADGSPVDPDIKFGVLRDADYRKKTMTLSEERKALQKERETYEARASLEGEAALRVQNLTTLDAQIRQLSQLRIADLRAQGYTDQQISEAQENLRQMAAQRDALSRQVEADLTGAQERGQQALKQAREKCFQEAQLADKALTPERITALEQFAEAEGIDPEIVKQTTDPVAYKLLHYADIGRKFIERQRNAANMKAAANGNPATTLGGVVSGNKSPDAMSPAEMAKHLGY